MANKDSGLKVRNLSMKEYRKHLTDLMDMRLRAVEAGDFDMNVPTFVWGPVGCGKSAIPADICKDTWFNANDKTGKPMFDEAMLNRLRPWTSNSWSFFSDREKAELDKNPNGWILQDIRLAMADPVDMRGLPYFDSVNHKAGFIRFDAMLPDPKNNHPVFLFLDELPLAADLVQAAAYQLIHDRRAGDYRLPEKCVTIAAGNRECDGGVFFQMSPALENRFDHIQLDLDYDGFVKYMAQGRHGYDPTLVAFLQFNKEADKDTLYKMDAGAGNMITFRSWERALKKVKYGSKEYNALADSVGLAAALKFETFKDLTKDMPDAKTIVAKKMYFEGVELQLVAAMKVGNELLNKELLAKHDDSECFNHFRYFLDMRNPKDVNDNRQEISILFMVNLREAMQGLDAVNRGYKKALAAGEIKQEKTEEGKPIKNVFDLAFKHWSVLSEVD